MKFTLGKLVAIVGFTAGIIALILDRRAAS